MQSSRARRVFRKEKHFVRIGSTRQDLISLFVHVQRATLFSFLSSSEWERYSTFYKRGDFSAPLSPAATRNTFHSQLFVHVYFSCSPLLSRFHVMLFLTCTVGWVTGSRPLTSLSLIDYAASFLFLKSKNQGQRTGSGTLSTCLLVVPRPFDATNEPRLVMSHHLSSIAGNEHEYAYHPASTIFQRAHNANN